MHQPLATCHPVTAGGAPSEPLATWMSDVIRYDTGMSLHGGSGAEMSWDYTFACLCQNPLSHELSSPMAHFVILQPQPSLISQRSIFWVRAVVRNVGLT